MDSSIWDNLDTEQDSDEIYYNSVLLFLGWRDQDNAKWDSIAIEEAFE